ncbi:MAG: hypothetical protein ABI857_06295 [Acidobacteriota bacterium]
MKYIYAFILVLTLMAASPANGQKFLEKPYREWSKEEAFKVTADSPWAVEYQSERGLDDQARLQQRREQADTRLSGSDRGNQGRPSVPIPVVMRLHSALPVRQAIVRLQQIGAGYDKMKREEQEKFDASTAKFLECAICRDYYVVTLGKWRDTSTVGISDGIFQTFKYEDLKGKVSLVNDRDERLEIVSFTPPKNSTDSAIFFFKRPVAEAPFFLRSDKEIRFLFSNDLRDNTSAYSKLIPRVFEFKISKILSADGKIQF